MKIVLWAPATRNLLPPLTYFWPKIVVPVLNRPLLEYHLRSLQTGQTPEAPILLTTNPREITRHLSRSPYRFSVQKISRQDESAEFIRLQQIRPFLQSSLLLIDAGHFALFDWEALYAQHKKSRAMLSLVSVPFNAVKGYEAVESDPSANLKAVYKIDESSSALVVNLSVRCYFLEPEIESFLPPDSSMPLDGDFIRYLMGKGIRVNVLRADGIFEPMRTLRYYAQLNFDLLKNAEMVTGAEIEKGIFVGRHSKIKSKINENVIDPVLIGDHVKIARDVTIRGPVVIGNHVKIAKGAHIAQSVILDRTYVGKMVEVNNAVVVGNWYASLHNLYPALIEENFILHAN